jgi:hypothetical protein
MVGGLYLSQDVAPQPEQVGLNGALERCEVAHGLGKLEGRVGELQVRSREQREGARDHVG